MTNKTCQNFRTDYSESECVMKELQDIEKDGLGFTKELIRVFGAMQLNWKLIGIDWFMDYYWNSFLFGSHAYVCERFLVEKVMERNKRQIVIDKWMVPVVKCWKLYEGVSDMTIVINN